MTKSETILLISILLWASLAFSLSAPEGPEGIYLARGGLSYVEIVRGTNGAPEVRGGGLPFLKNSLSVRMEGENLVIQPKNWEAKPDESDFGCSVKGLYKLRPSASKPGDWDLLGLKVGSVCESPQYPHAITISLLPHPAESYLRRLDDSRVARYFDARRKIPARILGINTTKAPQEAEAMLNIALGLLNAHPGDLAVKVVYLDALTQAQAASELESRLNLWRDDFKSRGTPLQQRVFQRAEEWTAAKRLSVKGLNARDYLARILSEKTSLADRLKLYPALVKYRNFAEPRTAIPNGFLNDNSIIMSGNNANCVTMRTCALFSMFMGHHQEALELMIAAYRNGWLIEQDGHFSTLLIGSGMRLGVLNQLEIYAMNCCETPAETLDLIKALEALPVSPQKHTKAQEDRLDDFYEPGQLDAPPITTMATDSRLGEANARLQALCAAAAVRCYYLEHQKFPEDFAMLSPYWKAPPSDPFSDLPVKFIRQTDQCVCYGDGPDRKDDSAAVEYDSTNGTISRGDILIRVPAKRKYPFPRDGVAGASAEDLRRIFPNGLPRDPFSFPKKLPLGITGSNLACIFSVGPDTNDYEVATKGAAYKPGPQYDPTNGLTSKGDLMLWLGR